jgi:hypothetical protein
VRSPTVTAPSVAASSVDEQAATETVRRAIASKRMSMEKLLKISKMCQLKRMRLENDSVPFETLVSRGANTDKWAHNNALFYSHFIHIAEEM